MAATDLVSTETLLSTFTNRAESVGVKVDRVGSSQEASNWLANLRNEFEAPDLKMSIELVQAAPELMSAIDLAGLARSTPEAVDDVKDAPFGVSVAKLAVAETGSVLLAEESLMARAVGLLTLAHVTICRTDDLVPKLEEAAVALREIASQPNGGYATLVTGPSRTADIELSLTIGVQGPARVWVLFVDNLT